VVQFYSAKKKKTPKNTNVRDCLSVQIDGMTSQGEGVVKARSPALFVQGVLPGETAKVDIVKKHSRYWRGIAKPETVQNQHNARQTPPCAWYAKCGGCTTQHCDTTSMLTWKQEDLDEQFKRGLDSQRIPWVTAIESESSGYRRKARLAYDGRDANNIRLGFKAKSSSQIVSISNCIILTKPLQSLMQVLHTRLTQTAPQPIGHITLIEYANGLGVTVNFVRVPSEKIKRFWCDLLPALQVGQRADIFLHHKQQLLDCFTEDANSELFITVHTGAENEANITPDANDFMQVNTVVNDAMVERALSWLEPNHHDSVLELFAGLGNFTYALAEKSHSVLAVEGSDIMVQKARHNARMQGKDSVQWQCADLSQVSSVSALLQHEPALVLLDPSRDGAEQVCLGLKNSTAKRILYISCNPQTWLRDAKILLSGHFKLEKISLMDMFPYTSHTEMISLFERH